MNISFTQYLRPRGTPKPVSIDRPDGVGRAAALLQRAGYTFTAEVLSNDLVSLTIENEAVDEEGPLAHELCQNGPEVPAAVDRLVERAMTAFQQRCPDPGRV